MEDATLNAALLDQALPVRVTQLINGLLGHVLHDQGKHPSLCFGEV